MVAGAGGDPMMIDRPGVDDDGHGVTWPGTVDAINKIRAAGAIHDEQRVFIMMSRSIL